MSDNVAITAGAGTTVAADELVDATLGTVKAQYVKLMDGTLDSSTKVVAKTGAPAAADGGLVTRPLLFDANGSPIALGQAVKASSLPVVLASDQGALLIQQPTRTQVSLFAEAVAGATSEALVSFSISQGFAAPSTATSYTVPVGKTLRIHTIIRTWVATTTTANTSRTRLRVNASGAAVITSPIAYSSRMGWESATFIANEAERDVISLGEGIDVPAGGGVGMTHLEAAANGTLDITILGYLF